MMQLCIERINCSGENPFVGLYYLIVIEANRVSFLFAERRWVVSHDVNPCV